MKSFFLLPPAILFIIISVHQIAGNGIRVPLSKYEPQDEVYGQGFYGTISIGTPPQKINVLFDWKTNGIWMLSSYCNDSVCRAQNHSTYNHKISKTFRGEDRFDEEILKPQSYVRATDTITINNTQMQDVSFYVTKSSESFVGKPYDGIVGLNYHSEILNYCRKTGSKIRFSLYIQKESEIFHRLIIGYPRDNNTSELTLCGEDKTKFRPSDLKYITAHGELFLGWSVAIESILLHHGDKYVSIIESSRVPVALDPSSSYITGPEEDILKIYHAINTTRSKISNLKEVDCKNIHTLPSITFRAADTNFTLTGNDYIKQLTQNDQRVCVVQFVSHNSPIKYWILGNVFNRKFYTVFDVDTQTIRFAESIHDGSA